MLATAARAQRGDFAVEPSWLPAQRQAVDGQLLEYLHASGLAPDVQARVRDQWLAASEEEGGTADILDRLATCLARADERVAELVAFCTASRDRPHLQEFAWLADSQTPALVRHNMRLYYARWLAQSGYYDEAIAWTDGLRTTDVFAPESLLFYRAVAHHQLVQPDEASADVARLLERPDDLPERHQKLALLLQQDLAGLEDESLDHIARRMADIRRRLAQGRSDQPVQDVENGVVESLDKLIKKIEAQMQQQMQACAGGSGQPSGTPMQDSHLAELKAPGKVEQRDVGHGTDWGNLPPKDREQALQDIGREFPSHYRSIIEEYFRRLASEDGTGPSN